MTILQYPMGNIKVMLTLIRNALFICLLLNWQAVLGNETTFFKYNQSSADLDPATTKSISPAAISFDMVEVNAKLLIAKKDFSILLPDGISYKAIASSVEKRGEESWSWRGTLESPDGTKGSATLTVMRGVTAGLINLPDATYELLPFNATHSILQEIDSSLYPPEHPDEEEQHDPDPLEDDSELKQQLFDNNQEESIQPNSPTPPVKLNQFDADFSLVKSNIIPGLFNLAATIGNPQIDVLVVYTSDARNAAGGTTNIKTTIQNAVDVSNTAYVNSNVPQRIKLVHTAEINYGEINNLSNALNWVMNDAVVANLRNTHGADLVALITEQGGGYCGLAKVMRTVGAAFENKAFSTTKRSCAVGNLSFAHELGHNMGLEHDPANGTSPANASYPYSYGHFVNGEFRTVMSYSNQCASGCTRVPYFSNPGKTYNGFATGIANQRDNARALRNTDSIVAAFRAGTPGAPTLISPTGNITDNTPNYRWYAVPTATWYQLYVNDSSGNVIDLTLSAADASCSTGTGICSLTPATALTLGNGNWWVAAWNGKWGPWSNAKSFKVIGAPAKPTLISPAGINTFDSTPTYKWHAVATATWYRLWVNDTTGNKIAQWYSAAALGCSGGGTCTITPTTALAGGKVTWWVQGWNGLYGPWSNAKQFTVLIFPIVMSNQVIK